MQECKYQKRMNSPTLLRCKFDIVSIPEVSLAQQGREEHTESLTDPVGKTCTLKNNSGEFQECETENSKIAPSDSK